jgi:cobalt-zinc-cadmium efflux system protein
LNHHHAPNRFNRAFAVGVFLNVGFVAAEAAFGIISGSMALLADAGHNLSDVLGLLLAWGAGYLGDRPRTHRRTYGWKSATIMAALINALLLLVAVGGIGWESIRRLVHPQPVPGWTIVIVAGVGVVVNTATALLFMSGRKDDLNIRGAFLHMTADAGVSLAVVLAGLGMIAFGWAWLDPVLGILIAAVILIGTWGFLKDSANLALMGVPADIDTRAVSAYLAALPGVTAVHDLHIWAMSTTETALTAHLIKPEQADDDALLAKAQRDLKERFGIHHATMQIERSPTLECRLRNGCETDESASSPGE